MNEAAKPTAACPPFGNVDASIVRHDRVSEMTYGMRMTSGSHDDADDVSRLRQPVDRGALLRAHVDPTISQG